MVTADLHVGRVQPDIGPIAFERPVEESLHPLVDLLAQPGDLALGDAGSAHGLDQIVDRAGRDAMDVGFLDHGGQRLLGHAPRLEEAWKVRALPQLRDAQLHRAGPRLPVPVAIAVALGEPVGRALAMRRAGPGADLHLHQPLGGEGDHVAQNVRIGGLLHERAKVIISSVIGGSSVCVAIRNPNLPENRRWPPQAARSLRRYGERASRAACSDSATPPAGTRPAALRDNCLASDKIGRTSRPTVRTARMWAVWQLTTVARKASGAKTEPSGANTNSFPRNDDGSNPTGDTNDEETNIVLAKRYGVNRKTIAKWKARASITDERMGPRNPSRASLRHETKRSSWPTVGAPASRSMTPISNSDVSCQT